MNTFQRLVLPVCALIVSVSCGKNHNQSKSSDLFVSDPQVKAPYLIGDSFVIDDLSIKSAVSGVAIMSKRLPHARTTRAVSRQRLSTLLCGAISTVTSCGLTTPIRTAW